MFRNIPATINHFTRNTIKNQRFLHMSTSKYQINPNASKYRLHNDTEGYYWQSPYEKIVVPDFTLDEYLWKNVLKWENKIAIVCIRANKKTRTKTN